MAWLGAQSRTGVCFEGGGVVRGLREQGGQGKGIWQERKVKVVGQKGNMKPEEKGNQASATWLESFILA